MKTGIESIGFYAPRHFVDLRDLADARGAPAAKFTEGIGQERMAVPAPGEDIVTMAANAAEVALTGIDPTSVDTLIVATESGIDQSKAAAIYVHRLLGLPARCRTFEVKQACCSSTAALQMALGNAAMKPDKRTLIVAADVARYGLKTPGEPTQGAGAVAMVVSSHPHLLAIHPESGCYTEDVMDFWRPNYLDEALVDGKYSIRVYMKALEESWKAYTEESTRQFDGFSRFCYHMPFSRMANKAHSHLAHIAGVELDAAQVHHQVGMSQVYNRQVGNCYTASLYLGLLSLLEHDSEDLGGKEIALFSYGSGCMGSFFSGAVAPEYRDHLHATRHQHMVANRIRLTVPEYEQFYGHVLPTDGSDYLTPHHPTGNFRLAGLNDHKRMYEAVATSKELPPVTKDSVLAVC